MTGEFTFKRMEGLREEVRRLTSELLDDFARRPQPADLYKHVTLPLPSLVICALLGVPYEQHDEFQRLATQFLQHTQTYEKAAAALRGLGEFLEPILESKADEPAEDMLTLLWGYVEKGEMTKDEALGLSLLMLHAGHDTTSKTLALSTLVLLEHPDQRDELLADPTLLPNAIEELLRYLSVVHIGMRRIAVEDVELGGVTVKAGEGVVIALHSANRDPSVFEDPGPLRHPPPERATPDRLRLRHPPVPRTAARAPRARGRDPDHLRAPPGPAARNPSRRARAQASRERLLRGRAARGVVRADGWTQLTATHAAAGTSAAAPPRTLLIDADVHERYSSVEDLFPFLDPVWRHHLSTPGWRWYGSTVDPMPYLAPITGGRPEWLHPDGSQQSDDLEATSRHLFEEEGVTTAILNGSPSHHFSAHEDRLRARPGARRGVQRLADRDWLEPDLRFRGSVHVVRTTRRRPRARSTRRRHPQMVQVFLPPDA